MRILVAFGTRPEAVKCFPVVEALQRTKRVEVAVCVSGQHREILRQVLDLVRLKPEYDLGPLQSSSDLTTMTCNLLEGLGRVLDSFRPDRLLVQGDTATTMAGALAAVQRKIAVGHIEAGLRSGDPLAPWPEEINRRIVSVIADLHFAPTMTARQNLLDENIAAGRIHVTGNTAIDALLSIQRRLEQRNAISPHIRDVVEGASCDGRRLVLVTTHRRENWGSGVGKICQISRTLARRGDIQIVFPVHPNPLVREPVRESLSNCSGVTLLEPLDYLSFIDLMRRCSLILTDSGGIQEEAPALGIPVLVLRETTERPEGIAAGSARLVGLDPLRVTAEASRLLDSEVAYKAMSEQRSPFGDGTAAARIAAIVASEAARRSLNPERLPSWWYGHVTPPAIPLDIATLHSKQRGMRT
jgi:UDP-N-acetylglucosamine 2-epimerase (non-hydrolysing)